MQDTGCVVNTEFRGESMPQPEIHSCLPEEAHCCSAKTKVIKCETINLDVDETHIPRDKHVCI